MNQFDRNLLEKKYRDKGMTMIELIIGIAIMSMVGLMAGSLYSSSFRMYRSTISYADVQTESQMAGKRIMSVIMNAQNLYYDDSADGTFLFTGNVKAETDRTIYDGEIIWFNKATKCLYQNSSVSINAGAAASSGEEPLTASMVKKALEEGVDTREYLVSDKIETLKFEVSPELKASDKIKDSDDFYLISSEITVQYHMLLKYLDSKDYHVESSATPRNHLGYLRWKTN